MSLKIFHLGGRMEDKNNNKKSKFYKKIDSLSQKVKDTTRTY